MRILAVDTATESCSAALLIDGRVSAREQLLERGHAEHILSMVDALLAEAGTTLRTLSAIAYGRGPGAFTGVRLAASVTQGLGFGAGVPVVPVSDLQALAQRALGTEASLTQVLVCTDARMREVYWGCFERTAAGLAGPLGEEHVGPPLAVTLPPSWFVSGQALAHGRPAGRGAPLSQRCAAGTGFAVYPQLREILGEAFGVILETLLPRAREIAELAVSEVAAGRVLPPERALPVYLRNEVTHRPAGGH